MQSPGRGSSRRFRGIDTLPHRPEHRESEQLNWRTSIVDLLKLLDIDSSAAARRELADELGAPAGLQDGSAEMNTWLHRTVWRKVADTGGNVPKELLD